MLLLIGECLKDTWLPFNSQGVVVSRHGTYALVYTIPTFFLYSFLPTFCSNLHASIAILINMHPYLAKEGYTYLVLHHAFATCSSGRILHAQTNHNKHRSYFFEISSLNRYLFSQGANACGVLLFATYKIIESAIRIAY